MDDLAYMVGIGYFAFDSQGPYSYELKTKYNSPPTPRLKILRIVSTIMIRMCLFPLDTSTLCEGLTYSYNGGNCDTPNHAWQLDILTPSQDPFYLSCLPHPPRLVPQGQLNPLTTIIKTHYQSDNGRSCLHGRHRILCY